MQLGGNPRYMIDPFSPEALGGLNMYSEREQVGIVYNMPSLNELQLNTLYPGYLS